MEIEVLREFLVENPNGGMKEYLEWLLKKNQEAAPDSSFEDQRCIVKIFGK